MTHSFSRRQILRAGLASGAGLAAAAVHAKPVELYKPGTYSAKAAGIAGDVKVTMTFESDRIADVVIDASTETPAIGQVAANKLKDAILATQGTQVDAISGASVTSNAVMRAAKKCVDQAQGKIPVEVITEKSETETLTTGDWLGKPPVINEKDIVKTIRTEVVVAGCGTSGMFAVASAAESGAKVIGIDRFGVGTGVREGFAAIGSRYQQKWGTKIDKFDFVTLATQIAGGHVDQRLHLTFAERSGEVMNWYGDRLAERGVELWHETVDNVEGARYPAIPTCHTPRWPQARWESKEGKKPLNGNVVLYDYAVKHGAEFHYNTKMVKLEKGKGRITGLIAQNGDGQYVRYVTTKGVVIATGGYCRNYEMLEALQPWNLRVLGGNKSMPGAMGDGIKACLWVGAKMDETHSMAQFDRSALRPDQEPGIEAMKKSDMGTFWPGSQPWLKVNADGERFFNESGTYEGILHAQRGRTLCNTPVWLGVHAYIRILMVHVQSLPGSSLNQRFFRNSLQTVLYKRQTRLKSLQQNYVYLLKPSKRPSLVIMNSLTRVLMKTLVKKSIVCRPLRSRHFMA